MHSVNITAHTLLSQLMHLKHFRGINQIEHCIGLNRTNIKYKGAATF